MPEDPFETDPMAIHLIGQRPGQGPTFDRSFFRSTFDTLVERLGKDQATRLTLFLLDGSTLQVCQIDELADEFMVVRGYTGDEERCEVAVNLIPYGLIYRIELAPKEGQDGRVGFRWAQPPAK